MDQLTKMHAGKVAQVLSQLRIDDACAVLASFEQTDPRWCVTVLEAMPDERVRELLRSDPTDRGMPLSRHLRQILRERPMERNWSAPMVSSVRQASSHRDVEKIAEQVDRLDGRAGAQIVKKLDPETAAQVLDMLGTRKAKWIRSYM